MAIASVSALETFDWTIRYTLRPTGMLTPSISWSCPRAFRFLFFQQVFQLIDWVRWNIRHSSIAGWPYTQPMTRIYLSGKLCSDWYFGPPQSMLFRLTLNLRFRNHRHNQSRSLPPSYQYLLPRSELLCVTTIWGWIWFGKNNQSSCLGSGKLEFINKIE